MSTTCSKMPRILSNWYAIIALEFPVFAYYGGFD